MRRSVAAPRRMIESRPALASLNAIRVGERNLIGEEPIVVTRVDEQGPHKILEGWHARTGELLVWRWDESELRRDEL